MNWGKVLWWVITNAPELWRLIKEIIDLLERADQSHKSKAQADITASVRGKKPATLRGTIRADLK